MVGRGECGGTGLAARGRSLHYECPRVAGSVTAGRSPPCGGDNGADATPVREIGRDPALTECSVGVRLTGAWPVRLLVAQRVDLLRKTPEWTAAPACMVVAPIRRDERMARDMRE